jgi:hypothetical protein
MKTLFFDRHEDRVALARRQYFEEGQVRISAYRGRRFSLIVAAV